MRPVNLARAAMVTWALQFGSAVAAERTNWKVEVFLDDLCEQSTGVWIDNHKSGCERLDSLPDIRSIKATGDDLNARCGWNVFACENTECQKGWELQKDICLRVGVGDLKDAIKSYIVVETPCV
ncbi:hypothetical protein ETB97_007264 [Aspergillus alliaceus]|uniref:Cyanovirin-N domain-containing protein n=1 Tax=Petromyces alliaceus TaxID=209559 RepID=A0A5N7CB75_PETAA|nr:hypothetical protein BDV23DRAFT_182818 [Aspergillus alliaceus]KAF5856509.1 hypothetical protein ETB97_007264 [Aspergillus burnettii]